MPVFDLSEVDRYGAGVPRDVSAFESTGLACGGIIAAISEAPAATRCQPILVLPILSAKLPQSRHDSPS